MIWDFNKYKDNIAIIDELGIKLSYQSLQVECEKLIDNIEKRCLIFSLCTNSIGSILGYTAFINSQIVPVLLSNKIDSDFIENLISTYKPSYLWIPKEQIEQFNDMENIYETQGYSLLKTNFTSEYPLYSDLGLLLTTSGSTGSPKFVRQSYRNIKSNAESIVKYLELDETERPITTLPMNYTYGLSIINSHFLVGATLLVTDKAITQKEFWQFFRQNEATSFGGVPYIYEILHKFRMLRMELPSLRTMTQAGGKLTPELHKIIAEYAQKENKKFIVMYGQCEATARMGYLPANMAIEKCGAMGIEIPGGIFTLINEQGLEIKEPETSGELCYEGPNVTLGYAETGEDLIKGDERQGILHTGDIAKYDADGYYYIVGRKKRFLKIYGIRVNMDEIERMVKMQFTDIECAGTGEDDHLYLFTTNSNLNSEIKEFVVKKTGIHPNAIKIITVGEIPKNDAGKILYKELEQHCL